MAQYQGVIKIDPANPTSQDIYLTIAQFSNMATVTPDCTNQTSLDAAMQSLNDFFVANGAKEVSISASYTAPTLSINYSYQYTVQNQFGFQIIIDDYFFTITSDAVTACDTCQEKVFSACQASYTIVAGLTASTEYTVVLTDRNEVRYTQAVTTDVSGDLTIDMTDIPSGLLTPESGGFLFEVYTDSGLTTKADITANGHIYGCIQLTFEHTTTTTNNL